jgi:hypothetical protein
MAGDKVIPSSPCEIDLSFPKFGKRCQPCFLNGSRECANVEVGKPRAYMKSDIIVSRSSICALMPCDHVII